MYFPFYLLLEGWEPLKLPVFVTYRFDCNSVEILLLLTQILLYILRRLWQYVSGFNAGHPQVIHIQERSRGI